MKKGIVICFVFTLMLITVACGTLEQKARDTAAGLSGAIVVAQAQYLDSCTADKTQKVCVVINQAVSGQNALVTAIETYCSMPVTTVPPSQDAKCTPVKSAQGALEIAIANANALTTQIKGAIKP